MVDRIRRQLTLFVEQENAVTIEKVRKQFNPRQSELIKSHVTLCRENEIEDIETVLCNLTNQTQSEIVIEFGKAIRFDNGKGVLLPSISNNVDFQELRRLILSGLIDNPGLQEPHITLMHPRNSTCTDDIYKEICNLNLPTKLVFRNIDLIEQINDGPWKTLQTFQLRNKMTTK